MITAFFSHSFLSHCSPHTRQACCDSARTLWSANSLIKVWMTSLWCWLLLLVLRQVWFFGKYAVFAPEIWSSASGNRNQKANISAIPFSGSESTCAAEEDVSPLHTASVFPPTYWESHLYLLRSLHSSYSRLRLRNAKSKPCDKILLLLFVCPWDSVSGWSGNSLDTDTSLRQHCCLFYSA